MKFPTPKTVKEIAALINAEIVGNETLLISGTNEIHRIEHGELVFVDHPKYYDKALHSNASVILINQKVECPKGKALLITKEPFTDFNTLNLHFTPFIAATKSISDSAKIGKGTHIQPNVFIGNNVTIGKNCLIHANVSIYDNTQIGDDVIIHAGTVIGSDGFYYKNRNTEFEKLQSVGNVVIHNKVEIGANCTIDKGVTASTTLGKNTKLDNLIQIGHDTIIGKNCLIASQVGIAGCCTIGNKVTIWGQVGIKADITIADKVEIYAQSGIGNNLEEGKAYFGSPAEEARKMLKTLAKLRNL